MTEEQIKERLWEYFLKMVQNHESGADGAILCATAAKEIAEILGYDNLVMRMTDRARRIS